MGQHTVVQLPAADSKPLYTRIWAPEESAIAALVIIHGNAEHGARYRDFAELLAEAGVVVYVPDLRGHGLTASDTKELGLFAPSDGWNTAVSDVEAVVSQVRAANRGVPVFLMGHSMGSILARCWVSAHSNDIAGLILSGTLPDQGLLGQAGRWLAVALSRIRGPRHRSRILQALSFDTYNRHFAPARTDFDWLSRDPDQVDRYVADPLCGFNPTVCLMADLLGGIRQAADARQVVQMRPDLPVLIASGDADPLANGIDRVFELFKKAGIFNTTLQLYPGARHEILNETNREEVMRDLAGWLLAHLP